MRVPRRLPLVALAALAVKPSALRIALGSISPGVAALTGVGAAVALAVALRRRQSRPASLAPVTEVSLMPKLTELAWVQGVGEVQRHNGFEVALLSIEAYDDGFVVNVRLQAIDERPPSFAIGSPELPLSVVDDRGRRYEPRVPDGHGSRGAHLQRRFSYVFAPALDPNVRDLFVQANEIRWARYSPSQQRPLVMDSIRGPWRFVVPLPLARMTAGGVVEPGTRGSVRITGEGSATREIQ